MVRIELNKDWKALSGETASSDFFKPQEVTAVDLPIDGAFAFDSENKSVITLYKTLPKLSEYNKVMLEISGSLGVTDVYVNGDLVKTVTHSAKSLVDIKESLINGENTLKLVSSGYGSNSCGIAGGVTILAAKEKAYIAPYGIFANTVSVDTKANVSIFAQVANSNKETTLLEVTAEVFNAKNKRVSKKVKKVKVAANAEKNIELPVKIANYFYYSNYDPYIYTTKVTVCVNGKEVDSAEAAFGIKTANIVLKQFKVNGANFKIKGANVPKSFGAVGNAAYQSLEENRMAAIKNLGFNAVRFTGLPADATLNAIEKFGLFAVVDIFDVLKQAKSAFDGHVFFDCNKNEIIEYSVKTLRNRPSVLLYSVAADADETYNRGEGAKLIAEIAGKIKAFDPFKLLTVSAKERTPSLKELEKADLKIPKNTAPDDLTKKAISLGREKDLFKTLTEGSFSAVDVMGYDGLHARYSSDKVLNKPILGMSEDKQKMSEVFDEVDKNLHVIGGFIDGVFSDEDGFLDLSGKIKQAGRAAEIALGKKNCSYITVENPEVITDENGKEVADGRDVHLWNFPKNIGTPVKIKVHTSGDIVALSLDGKQIGRKLAGKFNNYTAEFKAGFFPGKLEAVSFHKGVEHARAKLESVTAPKAIKLEARTKSVKGGDYVFVDAYINDKEGRLVPYAMRSIEFSVLEGGTFIASLNSDPMYIGSSKSNIVPCYDGAASFIVKADDIDGGKIVVKASSEGLLSNKATIKIKNAVKK